jgi:hypothetical protein
MLDYSRCVPADGPHLRLACYILGRFRFQIARKGNSPCSADAVLFHVANWGNGLSRYSKWMAWTLDRHAAWDSIDAIGALHVLCNLLLVALCGRSRFTVLPVIEAYHLNVIRDDAASKDEQSEDEQSGEPEPPIRSVLK